MRRVIFLLIMLSSLLGNIAYADAYFAQRADVKAFIDHMVKVHKFKKEPLIKLFSEVKLRPQVIRHINKPLEANPWNTYQLLFVNEWRIEHGVKFWNKYADVLKRAERKYGVPAGIIVATIGIESKYGQRMGEYRVMDSLSNLGFSDSPRAKYFRSELEQFLLLTREQKVDPFKILGSYAGAIGQPQFMPTSYRYYAVNFSGTGKIDLTHDTADVIGSIANYYAKSGWKINAPVAQQALVVGQRYEYLRKKNQIPQYLTIREYARFGVVPKNKYAYDDEGNLKARVITLENSHYNKEYWLGYNNFAVIKRYNSSDLYAMAVYQLSNYITASKEHLPHG